MIAVTQSCVVALLKRRLGEALWISIVSSVAGLIKPIDSVLLLFKATRPCHWVHCGYILMWEEAPDRRLLLLLAQVLLVAIRHGVVLLLGVTDHWIASATTFWKVLRLEARSATVERRVLLLLSTGRCLDHPLLLWCETLPLLRAISCPQSITLIHKLLLAMRGDKHRLWLELVKRAERLPFRMKHIAHAITDVWASRWDSNGPSRGDLSDSVAWCRLLRACSHIHIAAKLFSYLLRLGCFEAGKPSELLLLHGAGAASTS